MIDLQPYYDKLEAERLRIHKAIDDRREALDMLTMYSETGMFVYKHIDLTPSSDVQEYIKMYNNTIEAMFTFLGIPRNRLQPMVGIDASGRIIYAKHN